MNCLAVVCAFAHLVFAPGSTAEHFPEKLLPTWVTPVGNDLLIASGYNSLYQLRDSTLTRLAIPPEVERFVPSSMAVHDDKLYVANYLGKDVLIFNYPAMTLRQRLTEGLTGPEGIFVDGDGMVDVADFDGGAILRFDAAGKLLWSQKVHGAHGVTQIGRVVYGTALHDRKVLALDAATGKEIRSTGSNGPGVGQYIWPVGITADENSLLVIDALLGRITRLSSKLDMIGVLPSGNGPGEDLFGFPYGVAVHTGGYVVADTLKPRLLFMDRDWRVTRQITFGDTVSSGRDLPILSAADNPTHHQTTLEPTVALPALLGLSTEGQAVEGYNSLDVVRDGKIVQELGLSANLPQSPSLYWTWARQAGDNIVIGSPAQTTAIVIDIKRYRIGYVTIPLGVWAVRRAKYLRFPDATLVDAAALAEDTKWHALTSAAIDKVVTSPAGRAYLESHDLDAYLAAMSQKIYVSVPEVVAIKHIDAIARAAHPTSFAPPQ